jgi:hypothetical protein
MVENTDDLLPMAKEIQKHAALMDVQGDELNARAMAPHPFRRQAPARLNCIAHLLKVIPTSVYRVIGFGCQGAPTRDATTIKSPCEE